MLAVPFQLEFFFAFPSRIREDELKIIVDVHASLSTLEVRNTSVQCRLFENKIDLEQEEMFQEVSRHGF